jgi:N-acetylmuramoyl-L-alanine amidase
LNNFNRRQRARRLGTALGTALLLLLAPFLPLQARGKPEAWADTQFSTAQRMREALNGLPATERSRRAYQRVITAYRRVYYGAPASTKADPSVVAVAELLAEMGRCFNDDHALRSAIGQYKFLRREYPGSRDRFQALLTMGQIYQDDLKDPIQAKPVFEEFLRRYPHHPLAGEARTALAEAVQQAGLREQEKPADDSDGESHDPQKARAEKPRPARILKSSGAEHAVPGEGAGAREAVKLAHVTGIRHWSSADYTRVSIDLEKDTQFESQRIDNPERIVFDLADTGLASTLVRKGFGVDDGLLKKIRVAQFQPRKARIVLEVADNSDFDTFRLTDPPRLIVDIHGGETRNKDIPDSEGGSGEGRDTEVPANLTLGKNVHGQEVPARGVPDKDSHGRPAAQLAFLKEPETAKRETRKTAETTVVASSETAGKSSSPHPKLAGTTASKTVIEAEDDAADSGVTVAKLDPPDIKPAPKTARAPILSTASSSLSSSSNSARSQRPAPALVPDAREAAPTARGDRSLIRALGLKIGKIVIDPGHGGHDTGTIGPQGLEEKNLVLDVGRRLGKLLQARLGADVVFTRKDDTFIPLETRTAIANQEQADLFVSIHANSSSDPDARGVETYYLNFTSSAESLDVAARENAASDKSIHELQDLVKKIALKEKIEESREFASNVQRALHSGLAARSPGIRDRGVKKAPFVVLIGANMPSILAEISFVSNPGDEHRLETPAYRQRIAESLYRGISKYVSGLSGIKVASKIDKGQGQ